MKTEIGTEVAHGTRDLDTSFKIKGSKVNLHGAGAYLDMGVTQVLKIRLT